MLFLQIFVVFTSVHAFYLPKRFFPSNDSDVAEDGFFGDPRYFLPLNMMLHKRPQPEYGVDPKWPAWNRQIDKQLFDENTDVENEEIPDIFNGEPQDMSNDIEGHEESGGRIKDIPLGVADEENNVPGEPLTPLDFANAKKIELLAPVMDENTPDPIQSAGLFEGDIAGINATAFFNPSRNAIKNLAQRWAAGVVPYAISAAFSVYERSVIAAAFEDYEERTCIRFVPRTTQADYVYLIKGSGCSSLVGRSGSGQQVSLGPGCIYKGVIIHELMHALGFWHEQSRPDRDSYVTVLWDNIIGGMEYNFNKYSWDMLQSLGVSYDTSSVMHYTSLSFSRDGRSPTIVPKNPGVRFIGQRVGFSDVDVTKINRLYRCKDAGVTYPLPSKPTTVTPRPPKQDKCSDNNRMCSYWAGIGECTKNPSWMLVNCRKSCKQCSESCKNHNKDCEYWTGIGECRKNPSYMTIYCAKSCSTCGKEGVTGMGTTTESIGGLCMDTNEHCRAWAANSQCVVNPDYMLPYCAKSCMQC